MLKLKLQYFGHLMRRVDSLKKTLMLGGIGGKRRRGQQRMRWLDGITHSMDVSLSELGSWWWTGRPSMLRFMGSQRVGHDWGTDLIWSDLMLCWPKPLTLMRVSASPWLAWTPANLCCPCVGSELRGGERTLAHVVQNLLWPPPPHHRAGVCRSGILWRVSSDKAGMAEARPCWATSTPKTKTPELTVCL